MVRCINPGLWVWQSLSPVVRNHAYFGRQPNRDDFWCPNNSRTESTGHPRYGEFQSCLIDAASSELAPSPFFESSIIPIHECIPLNTKAMDESTKNGPSSLFCALGSEVTTISEETVSEVIGSFLESVGNRQDVLLLPPDFTRFHSKAGTITQMICNHYGFIGTNRYSQSAPSVTILPALGTHSPMTNDEIRKMYGAELAEMEPSPFRVHDWRNDVVTIGEAPASMVAEATNGLVEKPWPAQLNRLVWQKRKSLHCLSEQKDPSLVISIGQVVPHEVMVSIMFSF